MAVGHRSLTHFWMMSLHFTQCSARHTFHKHHLTLMSRESQSWGKSHSDTRINRGRRGAYAKRAMSGFIHSIELELEELGEDGGLRPPGTFSSTFICYFPTLSLEGEIPGNQGQLLLSRVHDKFPCYYLGTTNQYNHVTS